MLWSSAGTAVRTAEGPFLEGLAGPAAAAAADLVTPPSWFADLRAPDEQLTGILRAAHECQATGTTPARWITASRLDEARRLPNMTDWAGERVARTCGYASVVTFQQNFLASHDTPTSTGDISPPAEAGMLRPHSDAISA